MLTFSPVELRSPLAPRASQGGLLGEGVRSAPRGRHRRRRRPSEPSAVASADAEVVSAAPAAHDIPMEIDRFELPDPTTKATGWEWGALQRWHIQTQQD